MNKPHRIAFWLSLLPLLLGAAIFGLWLLTERTELAFLGVCLIWGGVPTTLVAAVLLSRGWRQARRENVTPAARVHLRTLFVAVLLLGNYPAAWLATAIVWARLTRYEVTLANDADSPWLDVSLSGGGVQQSIGTVAPHARASCTLWFRGDGALVLEAGGPSGREQHVVDDYVTHSWRGGVAIVRQPDGAVQAEPWH